MCSTITMVHNLRKKVYKVISLIWVLPTIFVFLLLYKAYKIKIIYIENLRIGNSILQFYSALEYKNNSATRTIYLTLVENSKPANLYWETLIYKHLKVAPKLLNFLYFWIKRFKLKHLFLADMTSPVRNTSYNKNKLTNLMSKEDNSYCISALKKNNIEIKHPFIVVHVRDSKYLESLGKNYDWSYHSYRDSDIDTYRDAIEHLISVGYHVVRTGRNMEKQLKIDSDQYFDYSFSDIQDDVLDIWLFLNSSAIISSGTGPDMLGFANDTPILFLNILPLSNFHYYLNCMWAPKILTDSKTGKFLTLEKYLKANYVRTQDYKSNSIHLSDLTSSDIVEITKEFVKHKLSNQKDKPCSVSSQELFWQKLYLSNPNINRTNNSKNALISEYWFEKYCENSHELDDRI